MYLLVFVHILQSSVSAVHSCPAFCACMFGNNGLAELRLSEADFVFIFVCLCVRFAVTWILLIATYYIFEDCVKRILESRWENAWVLMQQMKHRYLGIQTLWKWLLNAYKKTEFDKIDVAVFLCFNALIVKFSRQQTKGLNIQCFFHSCSLAS